MVNKTIYKIKLLLFKIKLLNCWTLRQHMHVSTLILKYTIIGTKKCCILLTVICVYFVSRIIFVLLSGLTIQVLLSSVSENNNLVVDIGSSYS